MGFYSEAGSNIARGISQGISSGITAYAGLKHFRNQGKQTKILEDVKAINAASAATQFSEDVDAYNEDEFKLNYKENMLASKPNLLENINSYDQGISALQAEQEDLANKIERNKILATKGYGTNEFSQKREDKYKRAMDSLTSKWKENERDLQGAYSYRDALQEKLDEINTLDEESILNKRKSQNVRYNMLNVRKEELEKMLEDANLPELKKLTKNLDKE